MSVTGSEGKQKKKRAAPFVRKAAPPNIRVTPRDVASMLALYHLQFATREQLHRLDGGGWYGFRDVMRALYDHDLIDRPVLQLAALALKGRESTVYGLTTAGHRWLAEHGHVPVPRNNRYEIDNRRTKIHIDHALGITEFVIAMMLGSKERGLAFLDQKACLPLLPEATRRRPRAAFTLRAEVRHRGTVHDLGIVPDRFYKVVWPDATHITGLYEEDTASETVPAGLNIARESSVEKKLRVYWTAHQKGRLKTQWDTTSVFVQFATSTLDRLQRILELQRDITGGGSRLFMLTTRELIAARGPFAPIWINGRGEQVTVLGEAVPAEALP